MHGVTAGAIVKRAKRFGWERDLSARVVAAAETKLARISSQATGKKVDEREVVDTASSRVVDIVLRHRKSIAKLDAIKDRLTAKVDALIDGVDGLKSLNEAIQAFEGLGRTVARIIPLERQAFGLDKSGKTDDAPTVINITKFID